MFSPSKDISHFFHLHNCRLVCQHLVICPALLEVSTSHVVHRLVRQVVHQQVAYIVHQLVHQVAHQQVANRFIDTFVNLSGISYSTFHSSTLSINQMLFISPSTFQLAQLARYQSMMPNIFFTWLMNSRSIIYLHASYVTRSKMTASLATYTYACTYVYFVQTQGARRGDGFIAGT